MKGLARSLGRGPKALAPIIKQIVRMKDVAVSVAGTTGVGFGSAVIGELPQGNILFLGAVSYLTLTSVDADIQATFDGDYAIGTVATGDVDVSDSGEADIISSTALGAASDVGGVKTSPTVRGSQATQVILDNTDDSLELNLNVLIDDANISGTASMVANGYVVLAYIVLGDD